MAFLRDHLLLVWWGRQFRRRVLLRRAEGRFWSGLQTNHVRTANIGEWQ
jgi:hypothetical protein